jgi:uncharacterized protein (DUF885 family)
MTMLGKMIVTLLSRKFSPGAMGGLALVCCLSVVPLVTRGQAVATGAEPATVGSKELSDLFAEIWQDTLKHSQEFASSLGDKRYDDQLTDYSTQEVNASLARGRGYIEKLSLIDTTGLPEQEQLSAELMLRSLIDQQEGAKFKEWEMPVNQFNGFHTDLPQLATHLQFDDVKDYDDYIARLKKVPKAFSQIMTNMELGIDDGRVPPQYLMEKVLVQTQTLAQQKPEASPFALPLKKFPATVSAEEQKRISGEVLDAISTQVLPAYQRFAKFLQFEYVPKGRKDRGVWALPDGEAYYAYRIRQSTTLNKTAAEIHEIGLDEVKRDEAEMLAIVKKLGFTDLKSFNAALKTNPKEHPASAEALIDAFRGYEAQMQPKLPELFGRLPKAKLEVVEMPAFIQKDQA